MVVVKCLQCLMSICIASALYISHAQGTGPHFFDRLVNSVELFWSSCCVRLVGVDVRCLFVDCVVLRWWWCCTCSPHCPLASLRRFTSYTPRGAGRTFLIELLCLIVVFDVLRLFDDCGLCWWWWCCSGSAHGPSA